MISTQHRVEEHSMPTREERCLHRYVYFLIIGSNALNLEERNKVLILIPMPASMSILSIFDLIGPPLI